MNSIETSVRIGVPAGTAFDHFTRFENYPDFVSVVDTVRRDPERQDHVWFGVSIGSVRREYPIEVRCEPAAGRLHWRSVEGERHSGVATVTADGDGCELTLSVQYQAEGAVEVIGDRLGLIRSHVDNGLERFGRYVERSATVSGHEHT